MGDLLIRNIPLRTLNAFKARARRHRRSLQAEVLEALERAALPRGAAFLDWIKGVRPADATDGDVEAGLEAIRQARDER